MTLQISLTPETEAKLRERASAAGKDVSSFVLEAVEEKLSISDTLNRRELPPEEWIARLRQWTESHRALPYVADDSRESIYEGRGE